ncbi:MAG: FliH/SctL family protein [Planctomycetes bacterium]|nr:FliH/SctL family protein [Planctomycetota bacterium]
MEGKIIKGAAAESSGLRAYSLKPVEAKAAEIVEKAKRTAKEIIAKAEDLVRQKKTLLFEEGRAEGSKQGFKEGYQEGLNQGKKTGYDNAYSESKQKFDTTTSELRSVLTGIVDELDSHRQELMKKAEADVVKLAVAIAERVILRSVELDPSLIHTSVLRAVELVSDKSKFEISVSPADHGIVQEFLPEIHRKFQDCGTIIVVEDANVAKGGVIVRTPTGEIDARLTMQFEKIREELLSYDSAPLAEDIAEKKSFIESPRENFADDVSLDSRKAKQFTAVSRH